jgi:hypothetical protein
MKYKGSCHCGRVAFEVEGTIESALSCNCSMCQRKGSLLWFVEDIDLAKIPVNHFDGRSY